MGTRPPHTTLTGKARHSNKNQSPPHKGRSLPCAASTTTTPTRRHLDAAQPTHHKLELELDRSQRGLRPISRRRCTDLGTGYDRSRRGAQPAPGRREGDSNPRCARRTAVFKTATFGRSVISPCPHNHSNHSMLMRATRHYHHRPGAQRHGPRGQSASAASTASAESTASAAPTGVNRGRRTPACESAWPTPAPARRACPDVPPPRPAPSPATRADGA